MTLRAVTQTPGAIPIYRNGRFFIGIQVKGEAYIEIWYGLNPSLDTLPKDDDCPDRFFGLFTRPTRDERFAGTLTDITASSEALEPLDGSGEAFVERDQGRMELKFREVWMGVRAGRLRYREDVGSEVRSLPPLEVGEMGKGGSGDRERVSKAVQGEEEAAKHIRFASPIVAAKQ